MLPDLQSRLGWGGSFRLLPLDDAGRAAALRLLAEERGFALGDDVLAWLLAHFSRDLGRLIALLDRLDRHSLAEHKRITIPFVRRLVDAGDLASRVLLVSDRANIVPSKILRTGQPVIATGRGDGTVDVRPLEVGKNPFVRGDVIVREGDWADAFYVLVSGHLQATVGGRVVRELTEGDGFGEIALLQGGTRTATITVATATVLMIRLYSASVCPSSSRVRCVSPCRAMSIRSAISVTIGIPLYLAADVNGGAPHSAAPPLCPQCAWWTSSCRPDSSWRC